MKKGKSLYVDDDSVFINFILNSLSTFIPRYAQEKLRKAYLKKAQKIFLKEAQKTLFEKTQKSSFEKASFL